MPTESATLTAKSILPGYTVDDINKSIAFYEALGFTVAQRWEDNGTLHWEVSDDGAGFEMGQGGGDGHGFVNMRDRMGAFGGTVAVVSARDKGTSIHGSVPLT